MDIAAGLPTLKIKRCAVTADNKPFEFAVDIYRGNRLILTAQTVEPILNLGTPLKDLRLVSLDKVVDLLDWLFLIYGTPQCLRSDNGP